MTHGTAATKQMVLDRYAEVFEAAGLAVLLYDRRGFGANGGELRQQINPWIQSRGYCDTIGFETTLDDIDPACIAVWGDSYSSGVVLVVAVLDERVAAPVVQCPALGENVPPDDADGSLRESMKRMVRSGTVDPAANEIAGPMPVVWDDQDRRHRRSNPRRHFGGSPDRGRVRERTGRTRLRSFVRRTSSGCPDCARGTFPVRRCSWYRPKARWPGSNLPWHATPSRNSPGRKSGSIFQVVISDCCITPARRSTGRQPLNLGFSLRIFSPRAIENRSFVPSWQCTHHTGSYVITFVIRLLGYEIPPTVLQTSKNREPS